MAEQNSSIQREYKIDPAVAAALRVPLIEYPGGIVPCATVAACFDGATIARHELLRQDAPLADILALVQH